jgi:hypothetical protein
MMAKSLNPQTGAFVSLRFLSYDHDGGVREHAEERYRGTGCSISASDIAPIIKDLWAVGAVLQRRIAGVTKPAS